MNKPEFCESCHGTVLSWFHSKEQKTDIVIKCTYCNGEGNHEFKATIQQG